MISALMSVYAREQPSFLKAALASLGRQTEPLSDIVLVRDGPLTPELDKVIADAAQHLPLRQVGLARNLGLGAALNAGLEVISNPWVMRFDSDDICVPERVAKQAVMLRSGRFDLVGGQIAEFDHDPDRLLRSRSVPTDDAGIRRFALRRNPFNHMTVCFRPGMVRACGGYPEIALMEDYGLWLTLLGRGARVANHPDVLVRARIGNGMMQRRGGWRYVRSEWRLQRLMRELGLKGAPRAALDGALRSAVFMAPPGLRGLVYGAALRSRD